MTGWGEAQVRGKGLLGLTSPQSVNFKVLIYEASMPLSQSLQLPQAGGWPLLARMPALCPSSPFQVTSPAPTLWDLPPHTAILPLTDILPPSAAHKPSSNAFYVHGARPGPWLPRILMAKKGQQLLPTRSYPPQSAAGRGAGRRKLLGVGLHVACSVILLKGNLRSKEITDLLLCPGSLPWHLSYLQVSPCIPSSQHSAGEVTPAHVQYPHVQRLTDHLL